MDPPAPQKQRVKNNKPTPGSVPWRSVYYTEQRRLSGRPHGQLKSGTQTGITCFHFAHQHWQGRQTLARKSCSWCQNPPAAMLFSPLELQDSSLCLVPCNRGSPALLSPGSRRKTKDKRTGCVQKLLFTVLQLVHTLIIQSSWLIFKTMLSANSHMY